MFFVNRQRNNYHGRHLANDLGFQSQKLIWLDKLTSIVFTRSVDPTRRFSVSQFPHGNLAITFYDFYEIKNFFMECPIWIACRSVCNKISSFVTRRIIVCYFSHCSLFSKYIYITQRVSNSVKLYLNYLQGDSTLLSVHISTESADQVFSWVIELLTLVLIQSEISMLVLSYR